jgi:hypothetical protein
MLQGQHIQGFLYVWVGEQRLRGGGECEAVRQEGVVKRLLPEVVAGSEDLAGCRIVEDEGEGSAQVVRDPVRGVAVNPGEKSGGAGRFDGGFRWRQVAREIRGVDDRSIDGDDWALAQSVGGWGRTIGPAGDCERPILGVENLSSRVEWGGRQSASHPRDNLRICLSLTEHEFTSEPWHRGVL